MKCLIQELKSEIRYKLLDFVGYPDYRIDTNGDYWSKKWGYWRKCAKSIHCHGYYVASLWNNNKNKFLLIHRLVLEAFTGPCPEGMECRHLNGIKLDNRLENLRWGTPTENQADRKLHGTANVGEANGKSKLTEDDVREIRKLWDTGKYSKHELARKFGLKSHASIVYIVRKEQWKHVE